VTLSTGYTAQIYHYFGSKDPLFDAVWEAGVEQIVEAAPIDVEDLPRLRRAARRHYARHPDLICLITWQRLERGDDPPHAYAVQRTQSSVHAIATHADPLLAAAVMRCAPRGSGSLA
jgi:AcrR family transcriptional regulator